MHQKTPKFPSFVTKQIQPKETPTESKPKILIASNLGITEQNAENIRVELTNQELSFTHNFVQSKKRGFKISFDNIEENIAFYCPDCHLLEKWLSNLSLVINQLGFHNQFKAIRKLGKGQFATVFEVENLMNGERLAVKAFSKRQLAKTAKGMESLLNEIKILKSFSHPNLQKLEGVFESDNSIYIVTELLSGGSLYERLQKLYKCQKTVKADELREFMFGIMSGLNELNKGRIAHRDLKLDNIMMRSKESFEPVIIDFGLATFVDEDEYLYYRCGTPGYVSPEVMNSKNNKVEPICDVFSAASVFYHLLTQKPLFEGKTSEEVLMNNKSFGIDLSSLYCENHETDSIVLLQKMLEINPKNRIGANEALMSEYFNIGAKLSSPAPTMSFETENEIRMKMSF